MIGVGSEVVRNSFVSGAGIGLCSANNYPVRGKIYVVRELYLWGGKLELRLIENPVYWPDGTEAAWDARGYSELEEHRQAQELEYYRSLPVHAPQPEMHP